MDPTQRTIELEKNYAAFEKLLPSLSASESGKYALMHRENLVNIFDSVKDAVIFAEAQYKGDVYSVQQITTRTVDLGYFSHALPINTI